MRLADFILSNIEPILVEWEAFARSLLPGTKMTKLALRDHCENMLRSMAGDMASAQSPSEQSEKSRGLQSGGTSTLGPEGASELHAVGRLISGFDLMQVVSEYRALRASVLRLYHQSAPVVNTNDVQDLMRFNESIDESLSTAVISYTKRVDESRDMFLAILGHDLRNPLNSIMMSAALLPLKGHLDAEGSKFAKQITSGAGVMAKMISDLLDYTRTRLGAGMPTTPAPINLEKLTREVFEEFKSANPNRMLRLNTNGDFRGEWDAARIRQAISNVLANAFQHGGDGPIDVNLSETTDSVIIAIHNEGPPIPKRELTTIFDPLVRGTSVDAMTNRRPGSIGLGLYIAREVVTAHGGKIDVESTVESGTSFTIRLPRIPRTPVSSVATDAPV